LGIPFLLVLRGLAFRERHGGQLVVVLMAHVSLQVSGSSYASQTSNDAHHLATAGSTSILNERHVSD
jgi:hypothetical protein